MLGSLLGQFARLIAQRRDIGKVIIALTYILVLHNIAGLRIYNRN